MTGCSVRDIARFPLTPRTPAGSLAAQEVQITFADKKVKEYMDMRDESMKFK
jgi:hypothetical protein